SISLRNASGLMPSCGCDSRSSTIAFLFTVKAASMLFDFRYRSNRLRRATTSDSGWMLPMVAWFKAAVRWKARRVVSSGSRAADADARQPRDRRGLPKPLMFLHRFAHQEIEQQ